MLIYTITTIKSGNASLDVVLLLLSLFTNILIIFSTFDIYQQSINKSSGIYYNLLNDIN